MQQHAFCQPTHNDVSNEKSVLSLIICVCTICIQPHHPVYYTCMHCSQILAQSISSSFFFSSPLRPPLRVDGMSYEYYEVLAILLKLPA